MLKRRRVGAGAVPAPSRAGCLRSAPGEPGKDAAAASALGGPSQARLAPKLRSALTRQPSDSGLSSLGEASSDLSSSGPPSAKVFDSSGRKVELNSASLRRLDHLNKNIWKDFTQKLNDDLEKREENEFPGRKDAGTEEFNEPVSAKCPPAGFVEVHHTSGWRELAGVTPSRRLLQIVRRLQEKVINNPSSILNHVSWGRSATRKFNSRLSLSGSPLIKEAKREPPSQKKLLVASGPSLAVSSGGNIQTYLKTKDFNAVRNDLLDNNGNNQISYNASVLYVSDSRVYPQWCPVSTDEGMTHQKEEPSLPTTPSPPHRVKHLQKPAPSPQVPPRSRDSSKHRTSLHYTNQKESSGRNKNFKEPILPEKGNQMRLDVLPPAEGVKNPRQHRPRGRAPKLRDGSLSPNEKPRAHPRGLSQPPPLTNRKLPIGNSNPLHRTMSKGQPINLKAGSAPLKFKCDLTPPMSSKPPMSQRPKTSHKTPPIAYRRISSGSTSSGVSASSSGDVPSHSLSPWAQEVFMCSKYGLHDPLEYPNPDEEIIEVPPPTRKRSVSTCSCVIEKNSYPCEVCSPDQPHLNGYEYETCPEYNSIQIGHGLSPHGHLNSSSTRHCSSSPLNSKNSSPNRAPPARDSLPSPEPSKRLRVRVPQTKARVRPSDSVTRRPSSSASIERKSLLGKGASSRNPVSRQTRVITSTADSSQKGHYGSNKENKRSRVHIGGSPSLPIRATQGTKATTINITVGDFQNFDHNNLNNHIGYYKNCNGGIFSRKSIDSSLKGAKTTCKQNRSASKDPATVAHPITNGIGLICTANGGDSRAHTKATRKEVPASRKVLAPSLTNRGPAILEPTPKPRRASKLIRKETFRVSNFMTAENTLMNGVCGGITPSLRLRFLMQRAKSASNSDNSGENSASEEVRNKRVLGAITEPFLSY